MLKELSVPAALWRRMYRSANTRALHLKTSALTVGNGDWPSVCVLVSRCRDIFLNLALEEWLAKNVNLAQRRILLLWVNHPAVVIGRCQSPWVESNIPFLRRRGIPIVRRHSGGGTVYHDLGNLNISFLTSNKVYRRHDNMHFVASTLRASWPSLNVSVSCSDDLMLNGNFKISGSAARLTYCSAYHHCTLLVKADVPTLQSALEPTIAEGVIRSSATASRRSTVSDLSSCVDIDIDSVCAALSEAFVAKHGGSPSQVFSVDSISDAKFPGVEKQQSELKSWKWIFGRTPQFEWHHEAELDGEPVVLHFTVRHGMVEKAVISSPSLTQREENFVEASLKGRLFQMSEWASALAQLPSAASRIDRLHRLRNLLLSLISCLE